MRTGTGTDQIWAREEGKHKTQRTQTWHYSPLPNGASRTVHHPTGRGGGRSGGLKGHGDRTGQEASRAAPVPEAMAERGARAAMAGQGTRGAMADPRTQEALAGQGTRGAMADPRTQEALAGQGTREAMADRGAWVAMVDPGTQEALAGQGTREAMADRGAREAMADRGAREAMADRGAWVAMAGSPPQKFSWGNSPAGTLESRRVTVSSVTVLHGGARNEDTRNFLKLTLL